MTLSVCLVDGSSPMFHPLQIGERMPFELIRDAEGYRVESSSYPHVLGRGKTYHEALGKVWTGILFYEQRDYYFVPFEMKEAAE